MTTGKVYVLIDPRDGSKRYVGETTQSIEARLGWHIMDSLAPWTDGTRAKTRNAEKVEWTKELVRAGLSPRVALLQEVTLTGDEKVDKRLRWEAERSWATQLRAEGAVLFNKKTGPALGSKRSEPSKLKGRKRPNITAAQIGRASCRERV